MPDKPNATPHTPAWKCGRCIVLFIILCAAIIAADLWLKHWAFANMTNHQTIQLVKNILAMKLTENRGAILGLWQGQRLIFVIASLGALGVVGWFFVSSQSNQRSLHIALAMILAGAMGNLYDRLVFGFVRDMLWLFPQVTLPFDMRWPTMLGGSNELYPWIFNIADVALLVGIAIILLRSFFISEESTKEQ